MSFLFFDSMFLMNAMTVWLCIYIFLLISAKKFLTLLRYFCSLHFFVVVLVFYFNVAGVVMLATFCMCSKKGILLECN